LEAQDFAPAPLVVRPAARPAKAQVQTDDSAAPLPQSLSVPASGDNGLSDVLSSASANVAKPTLTRMKISQGVSQGLVIKRVQPKYPPSALATHTEGAVQIEATISKEGFVIDPKVLSGDRMLAAAALTAVRQWRYKPYYLDGEPVEIQTQITVSFKAR
jgi:protein TonB